MAENGAHAVDVLKMCNVNDAEELHFVVVQFWLASLLARPGCMCGQGIEDLLSYSVLLLLL